MEVTACPVCGSKNIGIGTLGDGIISGLSSWNEVCRNCGYQGASLVFESEEQYAKFIEALTLQKKQAEQQKNQPSEEKSDADKEGNATHVVAKKSYLFEFIISLVLTIVFFIILAGSSYIDPYFLFSQETAGIEILNLLAGFGGILVFFFLLIILGETLYKSIRGRKK
jgi:transcription elongation factor Elf1